MSDDQGERNINDVAPGFMDWASRGVRQGVGS